MSWAAFCEAVINSIPAMLFALIVFIVVVVLVVKGKIQFKGKGLTVGEQQKNMDLERTIIRAQIETAEAAAEKIIKMLPPELNNWRAKYCCERVFDETIKWIYLNHITNDDIYIELKQNTVKKIILRITDDEFFRTPEAEKMFDEEVAKLIKKFVEIRNFYSKVKDE